MLHLTGTLSFLGDHTTLLTILSVGGSVFSNIDNNCGTLCGLESMLSG